MDSSDSIISKVYDKFQQRPAFYTGVGALTGVVATGLYGLRTRKMRLSLYLINMRLAAQGSFVAILAGSVIYSLAKGSMTNKPSDKV